MQNSIHPPLPFDPASAWDYENGFYLTSPLQRIAKLCAHFELYKSISSLPGAVIECGVYKGASLMRWASFRDMLETPWSRPIVGFDAFGVFPRNDKDSSEDVEFIKGFEQVGGDGLSEEELRRYVEIKALANLELVAGDISETIPKYLAENPNIRIALLHIDVDVYQPTKVALENLYSRIVPGGLLVLDDYAIVEGETRAVDEFFSGQKVLIEKVPFSSVPAFIRKI